MTTDSDSILLGRDDEARDYDSVRKFIAASVGDFGAAAGALLAELTESDAKGCGGPGRAGRQEDGGRAQSARLAEVRRRERGRERAGDLQGQGPDGAIALAGGRGGGPRGPDRRRRAGLHLHPPRVRRRDRGDEG